MKLEAAVKATLAAALLPGFSAAAEPEAPAAYRAVEKVADGAYGLLRGTLFSAVLPGRLTRHMAEAPKTNSYAAFRRRLEDMPAPRTNSREEIDERMGRLRDAFVSTLVDRYKLELFGRSSGEYAKDTRNWDPGFLASASVLGGAYVWAAGVEAGWDAGPVRLEVGVAPGWRWRAAAAGDGGRRLARAELSPRGSDLALSAEWGDSGPAAERVDLRWTRRF